MFRSPWFVLLVALVALGLITAIAPEERTLGTSVRVVYLHGVWVWTALAAFGLAALFGFYGLVSRNVKAQSWSRALGLTGLAFWITYLPISMWAMQANWNGLFLAEPRWRLAVVFAIGGIMLQIGITLLDNLTWASVGNLVYFLTLIFALQAAENVMHPPSPITGSDVLMIQFYFFGLLGLCLLAASQVTRLWYRLSDR